MEDRERKRGVAGTLWLIGVLFTIGYTFPAEVTAWYMQIVYLCAVALLWPLLLGIKAGGR